MGFTSGFAGGVTVTLGLAYLTVLTHERNRHSQGLYLRSQTQLLNAFLEPPPPVSAAPSRTTIVRQSHSTLIETAKIRWNDEIENAVRWVQSTDWHSVRESMENTAARLLKGGLEKSRDGIDNAEMKAAPILHKGSEKASTSVKAAADRASASLKGGLGYAGVKAGELETATESSAEKVWADAEARADRANVKIQEMATAGKAKADIVAVDAKVSIEQAAISSWDTWDRGIDKTKETVDEERSKAVNAGTRGTVRGMISTGIEKGQEIIGKAQEAVSLVSEKLESKVNGPISTLSAEDQALRQRYEKSDQMSKTVEQALAERYTDRSERQYSP
ncbi:MAG: hypothetical protein M1818_005417 [Claussenomyces sp. TS43310]|nr:MAG: hypothetical protein M1818_005417 [Claussenomyces sp. TS43310]